MSGEGKVVSPRRSTKVTGLSLAPLWLSELWTRTHLKRGVGCCAGKPVGLRGHATVPVPTGPCCPVQVHIEFTEGEDRITLEGPTEDVNVAQEQIEAMVKDLVRRQGTSSVLGGWGWAAVPLRGTRAEPGERGDGRAAGW